MGTWQLIKTTALIVLFLTLGNLAGIAQALTISSGPEKTVFIELFTSQGCSSCPPAEKYLNSFKDHPQLWKKYVPLALHVDYWDYLGWKDSFASASNTMRQRQYARINSQRTIYTPGFFVNGKPWRRGFLSRDPDIGRAPAGTLKINLSGSVISASFMPVTRTNAPLVLNIAIVGMGFKTSIKAGEREGSRASHEFIQLKHLTSTSRDLKWELQLSEYDRQGANRLALVAWINKEDDPRPIQAAGGYLD
jgi:hypothetical protein